MITALKYLKLVDKRGSEEELEKLISIMDLEEIRDLIRTMVPEYRIQRATVLEDAFMKIVDIGDRKILETVLITLIKGTGETTAPQ